MDVIKRLASTLQPIAPVTAQSERIYAVGDLHGRLDLFEEMLLQCEKDVRARGRCPTKIILLGDAIDRGPQSKELVERIWRLERKSDRIVMLLGNHEAMLLQSANGVARAQRQWLCNGGDATLRSYGVDPDEFSELSAEKMAEGIVKVVGEELLAWLRVRPLAYRSGDYFFCHAGVRPGVRLSRQKPADLLWIREKFLNSGRYHGATIVHGHSEVDQISIESNRINLDTAAYKTGRLSAIGLQGASRWLLSSQFEALSKG